MEVNSRRLSIKDAELEKFLQNRTVIIFGAGIRGDDQERGRSSKAVG